MAVGELEGCGEGAGLGTLVGAFVSGDDIVGANVGMVHRLALVGMAVGMTVGDGTGMGVGASDGALSSYTTPSIVANVVSTPSASLTHPKCEPPFGPVTSTQLAFGNVS